MKGEDAMTDEILFEFEGADLVVEFGLSRTREATDLVLKLATSGGARRLRFTNPQPADALYPIVDADQVWISTDRSGEESVGGVRVEYWHGAFGQFTADSVVDLDAASYSTNPDIPIDATTRPVPGGEATPH